MITLLPIDASARTSRSLSRGLSGRFVSDWMLRRPSDSVIIRDVGRYPPPITTELWIGSVFTPEGERHKRSINMAYEAVPRLVELLQSNLRDA